MMASATKQANLKTYEEIIEQFSAEDWSRVRKIVAGKEKSELILDELSLVYQKAQEESGKKQKGDGWLFLYAMTHFLSSSRPRTRATWYLIPDLDGLIMSFWGRLVENDGKEKLDHKYVSVQYHQEYFFSWFLDRYNLRCARRVYSMGRWGRYMQHIHIPLFLVIAVLFYRAVAHPERWLWWASWVGGTYATAIALQWVGFLAENGRKGLLRRFVAARGLAAACHTLVPRLAGTVAVGLLFLGSSEEASIFVARRGDWVPAFVGLAVSAGYMALDISRRVQPVPKVWGFLRRLIDILLVGTSHATAAVILGLPLISDILRKNEGGGSDLHLGQAVCFVSVILTIGLIFNVIWAEEPMTRPL